MAYIMDPALVDAYCDAKATIKRLQRKIDAATACGGEAVGNRFVVSRGAESERLHLPMERLLTGTETSKSVLEVIGTDLAIELWGRLSVSKPAKLAIYKAVGADENRPLVSVLNGAIQRKTAKGPLKIETLA